MAFACLVVQALGGISRVPDGCVRLPDARFYQMPTRSSGATYMPSPSVTSKAV